MGIGGVETGSRDIARYLNKNKIKNYILCEKNQKNLKDKNLNIIYLENLKFKNIFDQNRIKILLKKIIKNKKINLVHISSRAPAFFLISFFKKENIKVITSIHNKYKQGFFIKNWYNSFLQKGDAVIFNSNFVKDTYLHNFPNKNFFVIPRGIDTDYFWSSNYNLNDSIKRILLPSRISNWKGHNILLQYFKKNDLNLRVGNYRLVFISSHVSKDEKKVDENIKKLNLSKFILFEKPTLDIRKLYEQSYIVVNFSTRPEGFGRTISEALSMSKPVIAPNIGGTKEQLSKFDKKLLFNVNSYNSFVRSFKYVIKNYKIITKKSRSFVIENFSSKQMCKKTFETYLKNIN